MNRLRKGMLETHKSGELMTELVSAVGAVLLFIKFGVGLNFFAVIIFCASLLAVFRIDMQVMIIPDAITVNGAIAGFILSSLKYDPYMDWKSSLTGILLGAVTLYVPAYIFRIFKGTDGVGGGDIKLIAMVGSFVGAQGVLFTLLLASLTGYLFGLGWAICRKVSSNAVIPFGPFISSSAVLYVLCGKTIINNIFGIFNFFFES
ncbi:MAG: A24 family peptidase [Pseudomonadota bacterium]